MDSIYNDYVFTEWDDMRVSLTNTQVNPLTSKPDYDIFKGGTKVHLFDASSEESVTFEIQVPHSWKEGTNIYPHVHWSPVDTNTGNVIWGLEYTLANHTTGVFGDTTTITCTDSADGTAYAHLKVAFDPIVMTGQKISAILVCRFYRDADAVGDTYASDAAGISVDFHYEKNSHGSGRMLLK